MTTIPYSSVPYSSYILTVGSSSTTATVVTPTTPFGFMSFSVVREILRTKQSVMSMDSLVREILGTKTSVMLFGAFVREALVSNAASGAATQYRPDAFVREILCSTKIAINTAPSVSVAT